MFKKSDNQQQLAFDMLLEMIKEFKLVYNLSPELPPKKIEKLKTKILKILEK